MCGSRLFASRKVVRRRLDDLPLDDLLVIVGGAFGPDEFAREWAVQTGVDHLVRYSDWERYGKRAGYLRNSAMLDEGPDLVIAFWDGESRGTKHTIDEARSRGIRVEVIRP